MQMYKVMKRRRRREKDRFDWKTPTRVNVGVWKEDTHLCLPHVSLGRVFVRTVCAFVPVHSLFRLDFLSTHTTMHLTESASCSMIVLSLVTGCGGRWQIVLLTAVYDSDARPSRLGPPDLRRILSYNVSSSREPYNGSGNECLDKQLLLRCTSIKLSKCHMKQSQFLELACKHLLELFKTWLSPTP